MARYELVIRDPQIGWVNDGYGEPEESDSLDELYAVAESLWAPRYGNDYVTVTFGARELDTDDIVAVWEPDVTGVDLYEDNGGGLTLVAEVAPGVPWRAYSGLEAVADESSFADDAQALAAGLDDAWTGVQRWPDRGLAKHLDDELAWSEARHVASYDARSGEVTVWEAPGSAAGLYLDLDRAEAASAAYPLTLTPQIDPSTAR